MNQFDLPTVVGFEVKIWFEWKFESRKDVIQYSVKLSRFCYIVDIFLLWGIQLYILYEVH